jgi:hypothetical protein
MCIEEGAVNMQNFWIVVLSILLPIAGILELFVSKEKEPGEELPVTDTSPIVKKGEHKAQQA